MNVKKAFGSTVKELRKNLGMTQSQLGIVASLNRTYISDLERGGRNPSLDCIIRLAHALEVPVSHMFPVKMPKRREKSLTSRS